MSEDRMEEETSEWMQRIGYRRVLRRGPLVVVSGCGPIGEDGDIVEGDAYAKASQCLRVIEGALARVGATPADVIRTRIYLHDPADWELAGRAHGELFGETRPVTTMVGAKLLDPGFLVEIEADAWVGDA
jgi:enamine deaminase RidA (YjgF/YER057c/UK114 family)